MKKQQAPMQAQLRKYLYQKAAHNKVPLSGTFELTPRCNMNCRMCYIRMSEAEMRAEVFADNPASRRVLEKAGFRVTETGMMPSAGRDAPAPGWMMQRG